jgi:DNA replication protein DnaC
MATIAQPRLDQRQTSTQPFQSPEQRPDCQECQGTGWAMKDGKATLCACAIERKVRAALPERYWNAKLEDFKGPAYELVMDWIFNPSDGLFITGACGTGKTHIAAGIVRQFINKGTNVAFKRSSDFYREVREMFKGQSENAEAAVMSPVEKVRFLVFDDLGAGELIGLRTALHTRTV